MADQQTMTYDRAVGRRKQAIAQVRLYHGGSGKMIVNEKELKEFFPIEILQNIVTAPLVATDMLTTFDLSAKVSGGGIHGQADAIRLGVARALVEFNPELRTTLKKLGYLSRDARVRERKKFGKKGARRSPQWSKR